MSRGVQHDALVESAERLFHRRGFAATGAREIAAAAGVPQGSFTNHFRSKEALGIAALDRYAERVGGMMRMTLGAHDQPARERLLSYFDLIARQLEEDDWETGCLIPDLATEASGYGEQLRHRLVEVLESQTREFADVIAEIVPGSPSADVAGFVLAAWHGTLLRMKAERSGKPLERFRASLDVLLPSPSKENDR